MGVRGLKTLFENQDDLYESCQLHDIQVVIDANNFCTCLYMQSQRDERCDLFGGDLVKFGRYLWEIFKNFQAAQITPILVFDGAQSDDQHISKTDGKRDRAIKRLKQCLEISKNGFGKFVTPVGTTNVLRSIAVDKKIRIIQCMFEADAEIARIASELLCPVISNDSDFFLMDLPCGVIPFDSIIFQQNIKSDYYNAIPYPPYIEGSVFTQKSLRKFLPGLDPKNLALIGILAGNDYVDSSKFSNFCDSLPLPRDRLSGQRKFRKIHSDSHKRIIKILYFLAEKSRPEAINKICESFPKAKRKACKRIIECQLKAYDVPPEDNFKSVLTYRFGLIFGASYGHHYNDQPEFDRKFEEAIIHLYDWLKQATEKSVMSYRYLELINRNNIFVNSNLDYPQLESAHSCQRRFLQVALALTRSGIQRSSCKIWDRVGSRYEQQILNDLTSLDGIGELNFTIFDVPKLDAELRRSILLATIHCSSEIFATHYKDYSGRFEHPNAKEYLIVKFLLEYIDIESRAKLWKEFRLAVLFCFVYYFYRFECDEELRENICWKPWSDFINGLTNRIELDKMTISPALNRNRRLNCRLNHQITQLQSTIVSFNILNAFLGDTMVRIRMERWLNSCLIYNLAEALRAKKMSLLIGLLDDFGPLFYRLARFR